MKKVLLNQLRLERLGRLTIKERGQLVATIKKRYKISYRKMEELTGIPHSTLLDWVTGRQKNIPGELHISIDRLIEHFKKFKPNEQDKLKIKRLISVLYEVLRNN